MSTTHIDRTAARRAEREQRTAALALGRRQRAHTFAARKGPGSYRRSDGRAAIREDA